MLQTLGLDPDDELIYRVLVGFPSADVTEAALATALAPSQALHVLQRLVDHGLAVELGGSPTRYAAAPPQVALGARHVAAAEVLRQVNEEVEALELAYRGVPRNTESVSDLVDLVIGETAVRDRFLQLNAGATHEVLAFVREQVLSVTSRENTAEDDAVARGVVYRVVIEREVTRQPGFDHDAATATQRGEEVRVVDALPTRLLVVDRRLALLPLHGHGPGEREGAVVVRPGPMLDSLVAPFEMTWAASLPLDGVGA